MALHNLPKHDSCRDLILIELHKKPKGMLSYSLYLKLKDYDWQTIEEELKAMLSEGIISVTNKRFWARDALSHYPKRRVS